MEKSKVSFEEMPFVMADLLNEVKALSAKVDAINVPPVKPVGKFEEKRVLMTPEVCRLLGKTPVTIYRMVKRGELEACKKGRAWYFFEDEVMAMLENCRYKGINQTNDLADDFLRRNVV